MRHSCCILSVSRILIEFLSWLSDEQLAVNTRPCGHCKTQMNEFKYRVLDVWASLKIAASSGDLIDITVFVFWWNVLPRNRPVWCTASGEVISHEARNQFPVCCVTTARPAWSTATFCETRTPKDGCACRALVAIPFVPATLVNFPAQHVPTLLDPLQYSPPWLVTVPTGLHPGWFPSR